MPKIKSIYRRLPGRGATLTYYASLYESSDHLLQAASTGYTETYKRFYFRDIQAIIIRKTNWSLFWSLIWFLPALVLASLALANRGAMEPAFWVGTGLLLLGVVINQALGPTCICHVQTAVQTEKLPSLKRIRTARRILNRIKPHIEAAQGPVNPERLAPPDSTPSAPI